MAVNAYTSFRFEVKIDKMFNIIFDEFRLPSITVETEDVIEGGQNTFIHVLPKRVKLGTVSLKRGMSDDLSLLAWHSEIMSGQLKNAMRQITVVMYDVSHVPLLTWNFREAFPTKWSGPTLQAGQSSVSIEEMEFVYHSLYVEPGELT